MCECVLPIQTKLTVGPRRHKSYLLPWQDHDTTYRKPANSTQHDNSMRNLSTSLANKKLCAKHRLQIGCNDATWEAVQPQLREATAMRGSPEPFPKFYFNLTSLRHDGSVLHYYRVLWPRGRHRQGFCHHYRVFARCPRCHDRSRRAVGRELQSLSSVLSPLARSISGTAATTIPATLIAQVGFTLSDCKTVVEQIDEKIQKYRRDKIFSRAAWAIFGQTDTNKLRTSLEYYNPALGLGLHAISVFLRPFLRVLEVVLNPP